MIAEKIVARKRVIEALNVVIDHFGEQMHPNTLDKLRDLHVEVLREAEELAQLEAMLQKHGIVLPGVADVAKVVSPPATTEPPATKVVGDVAPHADEEPAREAEVEGDGMRQDPPISMARPDGIPSNLEMVEILLKEAKAKGAGVMTANALLAGIRQRWWPTAPTTLTASFHDFVTRGKLKRTIAGTFSLAPEGTVGVKRDVVLAAKREAATPQAGASADDRSFEHGGKEVMLSPREWRLVSKLYQVLGRGLAYTPDILGTHLWINTERKPNDVRGYIAMMKAPVNEKIAPLGLSLEQSPMGFYLKDKAS